ncbi:MAG: hypothetical protein ACD_81C00123G0002 [uncultured bacterium]|uniref:Uncharacterized protein n=1 Tax=Candidatus Wolfebacteria bacterium GW2011_GWE2_44_13 TaxID=1619017 RepID=A0A0G1HAV3_9BACT|nr:MAG: hypothetical protein ACD_81C00123G0002 [uncultured bacterium]KKT43638.1 MAG: hypothetical protein UW32_C0001G0230 [Candidatus Wolfebacteria bacterium GW2011_GWE2_44_13]
MFAKDYLETLKARGKKSHVYKQFQDIGLQLAQILGDAKHKALYIKLAKQHDESILMSIAKDTADRKGIANKGAYFMKVLHERYPLPKAPKGVKAPTEKKPRKEKVPPIKKEHDNERSANLDDKQQVGGKVSQETTG